MVYVNFKATQPNSPTLSDSLNCDSSSSCSWAKAMCGLSSQSQCISFANPTIYWLYGRLTQSMLQSKHRKDHHHCICTLRNSRMEGLPHHHLASKGQAIEKKVFFSSSVTFFFWILKIIFNYYEWVCLCVGMCRWVQLPTESKRAHAIFLGAEVRLLWAAWRCWDWNSGLLQGQHMFLSTELPLWGLESHLNYYFLKVYYFGERKTSQVSV